jgi:predicted metal-dependent hydrolase
MGNKMNKAEEGEEDFPQEEENGNGNGSDEEPTDEELENSLQKQLASLQKQIDGLDISKAVKNESENRLRKMGFKEENGLQKPQLSNSFGADETPIKKAQTVNDVVDQLTNLSYKELRKMQEYKRQGLNEGLPDEIANL